MLGQQLNYNVAVYCRLSKDDGKEEQSSSIETQKAMLTKYVKEQGWHIYNTYIDDGYSGMNFERPALKLMKEDIENGNVNLVITKDLSRLGRNYLETGAFIEIYFPENNCRYIALNDGVDTINTSSVDITPFKNLINDMYVKDISRKIKSARRARTEQGRYMGTRAPYGYKKNPNKKYQLIIDEETAPIVRRIFKLAKEGLGIAKIRKILTNDKIFRPAYYDETHFQHIFDGKPENYYFNWTNNSVRGILRNPVYTGAIVGYRRERIGIKSKKNICKDPKDWLIVENTHEPIIDKEEFELVQRLITSRRIIGNSGYNNIFSGLIKCADCGYALACGHANRGKKDNVIANIIYTCTSYRTYGKSKCTSHAIEAIDVHNAVLNDIRKYAKIALKTNKVLVTKILDKMNTNAVTKFNNDNAELRKSKKRLNVLDNLFMALYEDKTSGKINERNYDILTAKYEQEQITLVNRIKEIESIIQEQSQNIENIEHFVDMIKDYADLIELDAPLLNRLIERITVSETTIDDNGVLQQEIGIYYKFVGKLS